MKLQPYPFQHDALKAIDDFDGRCCVSLEQGLGKTPVSIWHFLKNPKLWPALVICPSPLKLNWMRETARYARMPATVLSTMTPRKLGVLQNSKLLIANYDILGPRRKLDGDRFPGWMEYINDKIKPRILILDESQNLGLSSNRTEYTRQIATCPKVEHILALSGTPFLNRPSELFPTLNILRPDVWPAFVPFGQQFCDPQVFRGKWEYKGATNLDVLHKKMIETCLFRRRKADVIEQLPAKTRTVVPMEMADGGKEYRRMVRSFLKWEEDSTGNRSDKINQLGLLKQQAAKSKLPNVFGWVDNFLQSSDGKLLLFAHHRSIVDALHDRYHKIAVRIYGSTSPKERDIAEWAFQHNSKVRILVGNIKAAGVGLNLTAAHTVAFAEMMWNPATHIQAEDRAYARLNDMHGINVYYLVAAETLEHWLCELNQRKSHIIEEAMDGRTGLDDFDLFDQLVAKMKGNMAIAR